MGRLLIKAGTIIKGQDLAEVKSSVVLVKDGKVSKTYKQVVDVGRPEDVATMNVGGKTLIPSTAGRHSHLALDARTSNHLAEMSDCEAKQTSGTVKTMHDDLYTGITTTRYLRDRYYIDVTCHQTQRGGGLERPKPVASGIGMRSLHGHGHAGMPHYDAEDFRKISRENITKGVDFLKVFMAKVIDVMPFIYHFITPEELRAVVEEAKSVNIAMVRYCSGGQRLDDCPTAGIDCLGHAYYITKEQVERVKKMDQWVVYTPSYALDDDLLFKFSSHDKEGGLKEGEIICDCLSEAIVGGLKFGIGTDELHDSLTREAQYIAQLGANSRSALTGVTAQAAKLCGVDQITGAIKEELTADLVIMDGNPLEGIKAFSRAKHVIQGGDVIR